VEKEGKEKKCVRRQRIAPSHHASISIVEEESSLKKLEDALAENYGWAINPSSRARITTATQRKAGRLHVPTDEYCRLAATSESELLSLVEEAAPGETYFFREPQQFDFLRERILPELIAAHHPVSQSRSYNLKDDRLRIWSAACSTGEEAFSLAIAFDQVNPPRGPTQVDVFATDVRNRALLEASRARYRIPSLRAVSGKVRERYFEHSARTSDAPLDERYTVIPTIRRLVAFRRVNLLDAVFWKGIANRFDLVVCSNLLLYLHGMAARQMVERLSRTVREGGYLMVAPAESSLVEHPRLKPVAGSPSFFQRTG
jgi:chemotaxis protein methyltransferase CheR